MKTYLKRIVSSFFLAAIAFGITACADTPPDEVVKEFITRYSGDSTMVVDSYVALNTFDKKVSDENVRIIAWEANFSLAPVYEKVLGNGVMPVAVRDGVIAITKRGNSWYPVDATLGTLNAEKTRAAVQAYKLAHPAPVAPTKLDTSGLLDIEPGIAISEQINPGILVTAQDAQQVRGLSINGKRVFNGKYQNEQRILHVFHTSMPNGQLYVLMSSVSKEGGTCPGSFFMVTVNPGGDVRYSPEMPACGGRLQYTYDGTNVGIVTDTDDGKATYVYNESGLSINSKPVVMDPTGLTDPSK